MQTKNSARPSHHISVEDACSEWDWLWHIVQHTTHQKTTACAYAWQDSDSRQCNGCPLDWSSSRHLPLGYGRHQEIVPRRRSWNAHCGMTHMSNIVMIWERVEPYLIAIGSRKDMDRKVSPRSVMVLRSIEILTYTDIHHDHIQNPVKPGKLWIAKRMCKLT